MANFNKVIMMGHLTGDPVLKTSEKGTEFVKFRIAVNRTWKGDNGESRGDVCYVDCKCYGKKAVNINKFFSKGRPIFIEGRLDYFQWEKEGKKESMHSIYVEEFQFIDSKKENKPEESQEFVDTFDSIG